MLIFIVESARGNFNHERFPNKLKYIDGILVELKRDPIDKAALLEARGRYADAAYAAAADAAAYAAAADAAAYAADAAAYAAAAYAAAYAAYYAYAAAAYAAYAADAADAAYYAAAAADAYVDADAAAYAAADARSSPIWRSAREKEFSKFADKLLELMRNGK